MGLFDIFSGGTNPADAAKPYFDQIAPMEKENYNPYIQKGNQAYDATNPVLSQMSSDPAAFLEKLMRQYSSSRSYGLRNQEALTSAGNTAAAGGMRGSINDINNEAHISDSLLGDDMQQWLQNVLGIEGTGLSGEQHLFDTGYDATKSLTSDLSNVLGTQGQLAFQGQANKNQNSSDFMSGLVKALGTIGGWSVGGPTGGSIGGNALSKFF